MKIRRRILLLLLSQLLLISLLFITVYTFKSSFVLPIVIFILAINLLSIGINIFRRYIRKIEDIHLLLIKCSRELYDIEEIDDDELSLIDKKVRHSRECLKYYKDKLEDSTCRQKIVAEGSRDILWDWNLNSGVIDLSQKWWELIGNESGNHDFDLVQWQELIHNDDIQLFSNALNNCLSGETKSLDVEYRIVISNGAIKWILTRAQTFFDEEGNPIRLGGSHADITNRKILEQKMVYNTYYDPLTELPNKFMLLDRIKLSISRANRNENYSFTLLYLDYDGFKHINDTYGHNSGDKLLIKIANRLQEDLRPLDLVSRVGGDEFVIILDGVSEEVTLKPILNRLIIDSKSEFVIESKSIFTSVSIGVVTFSMGDTPPEELLQRSDIAMYNSKIRGKGCFTFYTEELREKAISRWSLEHELHKVLGSHELEVYYQPIMDNITNSIYSFEALLRWNHPIKGIISPGEFIPAAEETGFITNMTKWLINEVCKQAEKWNLDSDKKVVISFNVTAKDFFISGGLDRYLALKLEDSRCEASWIAMEVTESVMIRDFSNVTRQLQAIRNLGIKIKLDDFGTGYSSLSYLNKFEIDFIKIDKSFIESISGDDISRKIVKAVILLAKDMGYKTVAEGVERSKELELIKKWGCDYTQGYYYSKPLSAAMATEYLLNFIF